MLAAYICAEGRRSAVSRYLHLQNTTDAGEPDIAGQWVQHIP
jgi:hypothetical protein